jgi:hypothetical protein
MGKHKTRHHWPKRNNLPRKGKHPIRKPWSLLTWRPFDLLVNRAVWRQFA